MRAPALTRREIGREETIQRGTDHRVPSGGGGGLAAFLRQEQWYQAA